MAAFNNYINLERILGKTASVQQWFIVVTLIFIAQNFVTWYLSLSPKVDSGRLENFAKGVTVKFGPKKAHFYEILLLSG